MLVSRLEVYSMYNVKKYQKKSRKTKTSLGGCKPPLNFFPILKGRLKKFSRKIFNGITKLD